MKTKPYQSCADLCENLTDKKEAYLKDTTDTAVDVRNCGLTRLPDALFRLEGITEIYADNNYISTIPPAITVCSHTLEWLDLNHNRIGEIPDALDTLTQLHVLDLNHNQVGGDFPSQITALRALRCLDLSNNQIGGSIPPRITSLTNLQCLGLSNNEIGDISIGAIDFLRNLSFFQCFDNPVGTGWQHG